MSNPMTGANVRIINELKKFLNTSVMESSQREEYGFSCRAFTRQRLLPFNRLVVLIVHALKRSLNIELQSFFEHFSGIQPCSKQAFCKQCSQLKPAFSRMESSAVFRKIAIKGFLPPYLVSEEEVVPRCLSDIVLDNHLLLFDRGYPCYWLMYLLMEKQSKFVMRVQSNANNAVKCFLAFDENDLALQ